MESSKSKQQSFKEARSEEEPSTSRQQDQERIKNLEQLVEQQRYKIQEQERKIEQLMQRQQKEQQQQGKQQQQKQQQMKQQEERRQIECELTLEQHDELMLFKISNIEGLRKEIYRKLPIVDILDSMGSFVAQEYKTKIKEMGEEVGSCAATKMFLTLATVNKLEPGWSRQLLQTITRLDLKDVQELISLNQTDLEEFNERIGIPRNSLLNQIAEKLGSHCSILVSPMGKDEVIRDDSEVVPTVHPVLCVSKDHFSQDTAFINGSYQPSEDTRQAYEDAPRVSFYDVTKSNNVETAPEFRNEYSASLRAHHDVSLFLIGPAGSGKTTMTKRIVKRCLEEKKMAFLIPFAQIDGNQRLSLKNLLTTFLCRLHMEYDPSEEEIDQAFHWVLANQDKCILIFDGLDQAGFNISNQPIEDAGINDEFFPGELISLLLSRAFLPNCRLAVSSRPHSLANFSPTIQPDIVIFMNDLLPEDVDKLMSYYLEHGAAGEFMEKLRIRSPRIYQLVFNPLFLRLVAMLNNEVGDNIWAYINTTAKLFFEVIDRLQSSTHHDCGLGVDDVETLNLKLAEMAFHKTMAGSVVFEQKDLVKYGLSGGNVQDFLFGVLSTSKHNSALLVGLMMVFYFNHQSTQEFFSARFALEKLSVGEFKEFVGKIFPRIYKDGDLMRVGEDSFANLRMFVVGIINEMKNRRLDGKEIVEKKTIFIKFLCTHLRQLFVDGDHRVRKHQKQMLVDLLDFREAEVISDVRKRLEDFDFRFDCHLDAAAHREAFFHFLPHFASNVQFLNLNIRDWSEAEVARLFTSIRSFPGKINKMQMDMDSRQQRDHVGHVVTIFPHLIATYKLRLPGDVDDAIRFCRKLQQQINNFDTNNIRSKELDVKVKCRKNDLLLHVILRHARSPRFITCDQDQ